MGGQAQQLNHDQTKYSVGEVVPICSPIPLRDRPKCSIAWGFQVPCQQVNKDIRLTGLPAPPNPKIKMNPSRVLSTILEYI